MALSKTWKELLFDVPHLAVPEDLGRVLCSSWHNILRRCQCLAEAVTLGRINVWKKAVSFCLAKQRIPRRELAWCSASHACRLLMVSEGYWVKKLAPPSCTNQIPDVLRYNSIVVFMIPAKPVYPRTLVCLHLYLGCSQNVDPWTSLHIY